MNYTFTKSEDSYGLLAEGEYEVRIDRIEERVTQNGKKNISIMFRVREDVEQEHKNRILFETIWKERDTEFYNRKRLNQLMGTQHFEDGKIFSSIQEVIDNLKGSNLIAVVAQTYDDYKSEDVNTIRYYKSSDHMPKALESKEVEVSDEEMPF